MEIELKTIQQKIKYFRDRQAEIVEANQKLNDLANTYRRELKDIFGVTDGEKLNMLDLVDCISVLVDSEKKNDS